MGAIKPVVFADLRGGRNDTDPPMSLPLNQCTEALNIDWKDATLARKRGGSASVGISGGTSFSSGILWLARHVPGGSEAAAELWGADGAATTIVKRLTGGTNWANVTLDDAVATLVVDMVGVSFNGKFFLAYDTTVDRLHVYDPLLASPRVRRVGINQGSSAPTVANTGAGAYAATLRYYRVRFLQIPSAAIYRQSEPTPSVSFTPSGAGTAARITRPTAPGEGETHWIVEAGTDDATFYRISDAAVAIATTTYDDSEATSTYSSNTLSAAAGQYALLPSGKFLLTDQNRLLVAGAWESSGAVSGGRNSRIWFTPVLGTTDTGDDERLVNTTTQKNWVDLNENDGGALTALGGPVNGVVYAFKYRQIWRLRPTGDVAAPYLPRKANDAVGCITHKSVVLGEDQTGRPALYFMSHRGPYRLNADGAVEYLGRDNEVTWRSMNLAAVDTAGGVVAHGLYYPDLHQVWYWIATGANTEPNIRMIFDVQLGFPDEHGQIRGGWAKHTGVSCAARASCLFSNTLGASMSRDLKPHTAITSGTALHKCDTTDADDAGTSFQGTATTRPVLTTADLVRKVGIAESTLTAKAQAATTVTVTIERDFGLETRATSVSIAPAASETRVVKKVEGSEMGEANVVQMTIGDAAASTAQWTLDALITPVILQEAR